MERVCGARAEAASRRVLGGAEAEAWARVGIALLYEYLSIYLHLYHPLYPQVGGAAAEAMRRRALAFKQYNQAALVAQVCAALPQFAGTYQTPKYFLNLQIFSNKPCSGSVTKPLKKIETILIVGEELCPG